MINEAKSFILYYDFKDQFDLLTREEKGMLIEVIFDYAVFGSIPEDLPKLIRMAFSPIKSALDRDRLKYLDRCEKNRENGKKGGRPKKTSTSDGSFPIPKTDGLFSDAKKAYNDSDNDSDNEIDSDIDSGSDSGNGSDNEQSSVTPQSSATPSVSDEERLSEQEKTELKAKGTEKAL